MLSNDSYLILYSYWGLFCIKFERTFLKRILHSMMLLRDLLAAIFQRLINWQNIKCISDILKCSLKNFVAKKIHQIYIADWCVWKKKNIEHCIANFHDIFVCLDDWKERFYMPNQKSKNVCFKWHIKRIS